MIMVEIVKLLTHFYLPGIDQQIERAVAHDWAVDLSDYDYPTVKDACAEWRRTQTRRPTVAQVIELCQKFKRQAESDARWNAKNALADHRKAYGEDHVDTYPRTELKAWWQAWKENYPAPRGMPLDDWKEMIRVRALELCPSCTWQMPGEEYGLAGIAIRNGQ
jgi:hypothetical protein